MKQKAFVITVDGASGTGKGIVSQLLAKRLGWKLLDSGSLYRVLALAAQSCAITPVPSFTLWTLNPLFCLRPRRLAMAWLRQRLPKGAWS